MSRSSDLLAALSRAYNLTETSGLDDPDVREALLEVRDAAAGGEAVEVEIFDDGLVPVGEGTSRRDRVPGVLAQDLATLGVSRMTIPADVSPGHLERFLGTLRDAVEGVGITLDLAPGASLETTGRSIAALHGTSPSGDVATVAAEGEDEAAEPLEETGEERERDVTDLVVSLAADEEAAAGEADLSEEGAPDEETGEEAEAGAEAEVEVEELPPSDPYAERIEELLEAYAGAATDGEEEAAAETIREEAGRFRDDGALDALARLVEELILAAEEGKVPEDAVEIAREAAGHGVMARIAMHLGVARQEQRREELITVACRLGRSMASAIADALTDAPDRSARRTYVEAMGAMGEEALEIAQTMAADSRWFIARNGVALLGELGGRDSIEHLTTPLAHSDPRLRKETVMTLAKLGGESAGDLCVGMLGDPDPDVRASAARAVGALRVEKAQRQLLSQLESEGNPDVEAEILRALGQLGDPGAVPALEKRAVGGLFSRGPTEIRIAAYRALAAIGTPHARSLLEQATDDKDLEVRTVARSLVERREQASAAAAEAEARAEADAEAEAEAEIEGMSDLEAEAESRAEIE